MQPDGRGPAQGASSHAKKIRNDSAARAEANQMDRQPLMTDGQEEGGGNKGKGMAQPEKEVVSFYKHKNLYKFFGFVLCCGRGTWDAVCFGGRGGGVAQTESRPLLVIIPTAASKLEVDIFGKQTTMAHAPFGLASRKGQAQPATIPKPGETASNAGASGQ
ncbi:Hypothetical predicted protein [Cloeon dipterum]|uniref:Uncharacterized protein n=1 Tax=Cloeon dipterum TaxID=197152 RepID=A0A8S1DB07_9INSE|nr:Hypothetical predicted protein [Cloeon dipterum]